MRHYLEKLGYRYVNVDIRALENTGSSIVGDAQLLPFKDGSFDLLISKDSLEHFLRPWEVVHEVYRVMKKNGLFVAWVPFMHPFHGNDLYRYSPLGLYHLFHDFKILSLESPLGVFTVFGSACTHILKRFHLDFTARSIKRFCRLLDRIFARYQKHPSSYAPAYRIVACKPERE